MNTHWTEDELIACMYELRPRDGHLDECRSCRERLDEMDAARRAGEEMDVPAALLAAQRRAVLARVNASERRSRVMVRRWMPAAAALTFLGGSILFYEGRTQERARQTAALSDIQLAQDVASLSSEDEAQPTAPLHALFRP